MATTIHLNLTREEAGALLRLIEGQLPEKLREISRAEFSRDLRNFLHRNYDRLEHIRQALVEACSSEEQPSDVNIVIRRDDLVQ